MTNDELQAARDTVAKLRGYQKGSLPARPESFGIYVQNELGLKISPVIQNLINVIKTLDARLRDLEGPME